MLEPRSSGAVSGSAAPARRRLAPANALLGSVTIRAEPPLPLVPSPSLKNTTSRGRPEMTSVHAKKPARPPAVCSLRNRSEGEVNISQGFEVNRSVSATLPSSSSHFLSLRGSRRREKWHGGGDDRSPKRALKEQGFFFFFFFRGTYCRCVAGCWVCVSSLLPGLPSALLRRWRWKASPLLMMFAAHS